MTPAALATGVWTGCQPVASWPMAAMSRSLGLALVSRLGADAAGVVALTFLTLRTTRDTRKKFIADGQELTADGDCAPR